MKVLILGASGMIGSTVIRVLSAIDDWQVYGTVRDESSKMFFSASVARNLLFGVDVLDPDSLVQVLDKTEPNIVINCVGLTKHQSSTDNWIASISLNSLFPHRLAELCNLVGARLIHISTDCVFSGAKGNYVEEDIPDAHDVYGRSKALGEVICPHVITLRISTIGHELGTNFGLLHWFLSQHGQCSGYRRAIFSGLPTVVFARLLRDVVIPSIQLSGLYHVASKPIDKFTLLGLIANIYNKKINIIPNEEFSIDRSLNANRFHLATGYEAPEWETLIKEMESYK
jgi:dTDP-4-dehydrorhamnose reductase